MIKKIIAFVRGVYEFRRDCTWSDPSRDGFDYTNLDESYDQGREFAHRLTFRHWDA